MRDGLGHGLIERDVPIRLALLAALAGEHVLLIGPPGTAKSELARRLHGVFEGQAYFERLLTRFSVPEELFGPLSIRALEEDRYERQVEGYLPTASVAFLDEIFKANSAILNALLTLLNERQFDNGTQRMDTPLVCVIGASNELPREEELLALYDRFLVRCHIGPVSEAGFVSLLELRGAPGAMLDGIGSLTPGEVRAIREGARGVAVPDDVSAMVAALRVFCQEQDIPVSDRRWRKALFLLQVAAHTDGRDEVSLWDGWLLQHCLWHEPGQHALLAEWYEQRAGSPTPREPERFQRFASAWEDRLKQDRNRKEHACDAKGEPWYRDANGEKTLKKIGTRNRDGYGYRHSEEEVEHEPWLEPLEYSQAYIDARMASIEAHIEELEAFVARSRGEAERLESTIRGHLWLDPAFAGPAAKALKSHIAAAEGAIKAMRATREGFAKLPAEPGVPLPTDIGGSGDRAETPESDEGGSDGEFNEID